MFASRFFYYIFHRSLILLLYYFFISSSYSQVKPQREVIGTVNGEQLYVEEFKRIMNDHKALVYQSFPHKKDTTRGYDFWNTIIEGVIPFQLLKAESLSLSIRNKVEWQYLKKMKMFESSDYYELKLALEDDNKIRKEKVHSNSPIYGPEQYNFRVYSALKKSKAILKLRNSVVDSIISEHDIKLNYEIQKEFSFKIPNSLEIKYVVLPNETSSKLKGFPKENVTEVNFFKLTKPLQKNVEIIKMTPNTIRNDEILYKDFFYLSQHFKEKEVYFIPHENSTRIVYVNKVIVNVYMPLNEVEHVIKNRLFEEWYSKNLNLLISSADVRIDNDNYENIDNLVHDN